MFDPYQLWHARLGHASAKTVKSVINMCKVSYRTKPTFCDTCSVAKMHQLPFHNSSTVYIEPLELVFMDIWGPAPKTATNGSRYYIAFMDAFSKYTWLYLINCKSQTLSVFKCFKVFAEKQTGHNIHSVQSHDAKEFLVITSLLNDHGILHRLTCQHTHQQYGSIERKHKYINEMGLALLVGSSLPINFWGESFVTVVNIINALPTPVLHNQSPYEIMFKRKPDYSHFRFLDVLAILCLDHIKIENFQTETVSCYLFNSSF